MTGHAQPPPQSPGLAETGQVYVTLAATDTYGEWMAKAGQTMGYEEARRDLTELLLDARRVQGDTETPERWRRRTNSSGLDLTARVVREGRLAVVVSVVVRGYDRAGKRGGQR